MIIEILSAIATVFVIILLGALLRFKNILGEQYWLYADKLVYWILFPAFLFDKTSSVSLTSGLLTPVSITLLGGLLFSVMLAWAGCGLLNIGHKAASSIVQASGRQNTFISLAIAERLFGDSGLLIATLAAAILVPITNIVIVITLVVILNKGQQQLMRKIAFDLFRNPILIAIALGFLANLSGYKHIFILHDATALLGKATLPVVLLSIGASMRFNAIRTTFKALLLSSLVKFMAFPAFVLFIIIQIKIAPEIAIVLCIYAASPTASSAFALARQMGGDHRLMASLITNQTLISLITLPLTLYLMMRILGISPVGI